MKTFLILMLIIILGGFLRLYSLDKVPVALNGDEAAFGYNAFSILNTGKDEHGQRLPFIFKSFGDYKPPVFVYLLVPFVWLLGLTELTVRLPIAITGIFLIVLTYLISNKLIKIEWVSLISAFLVAISSWAIQFSRAAWEASLALFFTTLAVYLFILGVKRRLFFYFAIIFFVVAFYSYHAQKIVVPLLFISMLLIYREDLKKDIKRIFIAAALLLISAIPAFIELTDISGQSRARGSLITDYITSPTLKKTFEDDYLKIKEPNDNLYSFIFHFSPVLPINDILNKAYAYISPANLFIYGDEVGRHGVEDFGVLYQVEVLFIIFGVVYLIRDGMWSKKTYLVLITWLVIGLIPAMITRDRFHSIRSLVALPPLYILEGFGFYQLLKLALSTEWYVYKRKFIIVLIGTLLVVVLLTNLGRFILSYFIYTPIERAGWWQYGYKQVVLAVVKHQDRFNEVVIDVPRLYGNPYIFFLFYQSYDPAKYNQTVRREDDLNHRVTAVYSFDKYKFRDIYWPKDRLRQKTLYIGTDKSLPLQDINDKNMKLLDEIKMPNQEVVFRVVETL